MGQKNEARAPFSTAIGPSGHAAGTASWIRTHRTPNETRATLLKLPLLAGIVLSACQASPTSPTVTDTLTAAAP
jgi:hypothetical protein